MRSYLYHYCKASSSSVKAQYKLNIVIISSNYMISDQYLKWILVFFQPRRESFKTSQVYSWSVQSLARCMGSVCVIVIPVNGILDLMFQGMESLWITLTKIPLPLSGQKKRKKKEKGFYGNSHFHMVQIPANVCMLITYRLSNSLSGLLC